MAWVKFDGFHDHPKVGPLYLDAVQAAAEAIHVLRAMPDTQVCPDCQSDAKAAVDAAEPIIRAQIAAGVRRRCIDKGHAVHVETRATALCPDCSDLADGIAQGDAS